MPKKKIKKPTHTIAEVQSSRRFTLNKPLAHTDGAPITVGKSAPVPATIRGLSVTLLSPLLSADTRLPMDPRADLGVSHPEAPADSPTDAPSVPPIEPTEDPPNE
jgi:hypothetical protein